jgi:ABC-type transport system involved in cytochrome c biogenesis permease subunit
LTGAGLALTVVGVLLGAWWAREHLGRFWAWDLLEIGGGSVLVWYGLTLFCLLCATGGARTEMLLGVAGNIVVSLSWFGPHLVAPRQAHAYGFPTTAALCLLGFVAVQLLLLLLAFIPAGRLTRLRA